MQSYPKTRLFVEPELMGGVVLRIEDEQAHYLLKVMRCKLEDRIALFNGRDGEWEGSICDMAKKSVSVVVQEQLRPLCAPPDVWLCFAPIKFGRVDYLVQKVTELGAAKLQPVMTEYTQAERVNMRRLRANAVEAAEQCERVEVPELAEPTKLRDLLAEWPKDRALFFADEGGEGQTAKARLQQPPLEKWGILIGPEGGFSPAERALLYQMPFVQGVGLGPRIMRADTAAITLLGLTQCWFGDWDMAPHFKVTK